MRAKNTHLTGVLPCFLDSIIWRFVRAGRATWSLYFFLFIRPSITSCTGRACVRQLSWLSCSFTPSQSQWQCILCQSQKGLHQFKYEAKLVQKRCNSVGTFKKIAVHTFVADYSEKKRETGRERPGTIRTVRDATELALDNTFLTRARQHVKMRSCWPVYWLESTQVLHKNLWVVGWEELTILCSMWELRKLLIGLHELRSLLLCSE